MNIIQKQGKSISSAEIDKREPKEIARSECPCARESKQGQLRFFLPLMISPSPTRAEPAPVHPRFEVLTEQVSPHVRVHQHLLRIALLAHGQEVVEPRVPRREVLLRQRVGLGPVRSTVVREEDGFELREELTVGYRKVEWPVLVCARARGRETWACPESVGSFTRSC